MKKILFVFGIVFSILISTTVAYADEHNGHECVDFGLPSGTVWAKYNVGATAPEQSGDYFAWGATESWETYTETEYTNKLGNYTASVLDAEHDAAVVQWGGDWYTPTSEQVEELISSMFVWEKVVLNGDSCYKVSRKIDPTQYIYLPISGYKAGTSVSYGDKPRRRADYLTSTRNANNVSKCMYLQLGGEAFYSLKGSGNKHIGRMVRPVYAKTKKYTLTLLVSLNESDVNIDNKGGYIAVSGIIGENGVYQVFENTKLELVATPTEGNEFSHWSDDPTNTSPSRVVTVNSDVAYEAVFTMTKKAHTYVDLGLPSGTLWAENNVDADMPEASGSYFAWGETETKSKYTWGTYEYDSCEDNLDASKGITKYNSTDGKDSLDVADDVAAVHWGGVWRIPSKKQMEELINPANCEWKVVTYEGVLCHKVTSKQNANYIYLPIAGYMSGSTLGGVDKPRADYWTSTLNLDNAQQAWYLQLQDVERNGETTHKVKASGNRKIGRMVRPVKYNNFKTITVYAASTEGGYLGGAVLGGGEYYVNDIATLIAIPKEGYEFDYWHDGSIEQSREITVTGDATYIAYFTPYDIDTTNVYASCSETGSFYVENTHKQNVAGSTVTVQNAQEEEISATISANGNIVTFTDPAQFNACEELYVTYYYSEAGANAGDPYLYQIVKMPFLYDGTSELPTCDCDIFVANGTTLTVADETTIPHGLTVFGKIEIAATGKLILDTIINGADDPAKLEIARGGELVMTKYDGTTPVKATTSLYAPAAYTWYGVGMPFAAIDGPANFRGSWVNKLNADKVYENMTSGALNAFAGYLVAAPTAGKTYTLQGTLVPSTSATMNLTYSASAAQDNGLNFLANSWMTALPVKQVAQELVKTYDPTSEAEVEATVSLVSKDGNTYEYYPAQFADDAVIEPLRGFFVWSGGNTALTLAYPAKKTPAAQAPARKAAAETTQIMHIYVTGEDGKADKLMLAQSPKYSEAFDNGADARKYENTGGYPNISVTTDYAEQAVLATNNWENTVLNFRSGSAQEYTFSFDYTGDDLCLKDTKTNQTVDLKEGNTYTFVATADDLARFVILRKPNQGDVATMLQNVWVVDGHLHLNNPTAEPMEVSIYTADGRLLSQFTTREAITKLRVPAHGVYFIQLTTATDTQTIKQIF